MTPDHQNADVEGEDVLPLSALNDLLYCERRCWLHRVAAIDADNVHTVLGKFEHERVDQPDVESRPGVRIERAVPLVSRALGLIGRADVVEFHEATDQSSTSSQDSPVGPAFQPVVSPLVFPIEYKHGPRRKWDNDDVQLCAQALCLEEMLGLPVPAGAVFHHKSRRRREVPFTDALRSQVREAAQRLHRLVRSPTPPPATLKPQCDGCSLRLHCLPEAGAAAERSRSLQQQLFECAEPGPGSRPARAVPARRDSRRAAPPPSEPGAPATGRPAPPRPSRGRRGDRADRAPSQRAADSPEQPPKV